jgi:SpoIID/LytB domain protein
MSALIYMGLLVLQTASHTATQTASQTPSQNVSQNVNDVSVIVLSRHRPRELTVDAQGCTVEKKPMQIERMRAVDERVELCAADGACVSRDVAHIVCTSGVTLGMPDVPTEGARTYGRALEVKSEKGALRVKAQISLESYTSGVVASELFATENAALDALSIVVRTYAAHARTRPRHDDAMLCDLTHCQVMRTTATTGRAVDAVARTRGLVLTRKNGSIAPVFHHAACGGHTVDAALLWPDAELRDVVGVPDSDENGRAFCAASPHVTWMSEIDDVAFARALASDIQRPLDASSLMVTAIDDDGIRFRVHDAHGENEISGLTLTRVLGRELGWSQVKSQRFIVERAGRRLRLRGSGFGHRVGLCQDGTRARARAGASAPDLLRAYFPRYTVSALDDASALDVKRGLAPAADDAPARRRAKEKRPK